VNFFYRNLSNRQLFVVGLLVPLVCTLLIGWLQWNAVSDMLKTREFVRHSRNVQLTLGIFRYTLSDAESCQFRYILTGNPVNLDLYDNLMHQVNDQFNTIKSLTADSPNQKKYVDQIGVLLNQKISDAAQSLDMEKSGNHDGALKIVSADSGRLNMLDIEKGIEAMQSIEAQTLWSGQNTYQHNFKLTSILSVISVALCLGFVMAIILLLRRLAEMQSMVTLGALTEMIEYEGGMLTIEEYLKRRHQALATHGQAQIEAERLLGLLERRKLRPTAN
jgi:CHASE3 domain sensor protein